MWTEMNFELNLDICFFFFERRIKNPKAERRDKHPRHIGNIHNESSRVKLKRKILKSMQALRLCFVVEVFKISPFTSLLNVVK